MLYRADLMESTLEWIPILTQLGIHDTSRMVAFTNNVSFCKEKKMENMEKYT